MVLVSKNEQTDFRLLIAKRGMSQREFANDIGISHAYLSQLINGKKKPSPSTAGKIAKGLQVNIEDIFLFKMVAKDNLC
jgi:transcriptional regulator with XRE-family HTH domain